MARRRDGDDPGTPSHASTPARPRLLGRARRAAFAALLGGVVAALGTSFALAAVVGRGALDGPDLARLAAGHLVALVLLGGLAHLVARRSTGIVESVFRQEDRLMQAVAHEVRSPLSRLLVVVDEGLSDVLVAEAALKQAADHGETLAELIDDLLETARVMSGGVAMPADVVRLDEVVTRVAHTGSFGAAHLELDLQPTTVVGSPRLMRRAVSNLVRNAAQHAYGGETGPIRVTVDPAGLTVDDDGPGVPPDELELLRYETPLRKRRAGLGLGLAGWVAELHGGHLVLANRDGGGFRARLALPTDTGGALAARTEDPT